MQAPDDGRRLTPREAGQALARREPLQLSEWQIEAAARILATVEPAQD